MERIISMDSDILKNAILEHFRFKKNYYLCATEVRYHKTADVLVCNDKEIIEIEIKISYSDFLKDFKKLKHKKVYMGNNNFQYMYLNANKLYYCVPNDLKEKCLTYLRDEKLPYGLIVYNGCLTIAKSCRKINDLTPQLFNAIKRKMILRLSSEMVFLRNHKKCDKCGHINKPDLSGKVFV
jgi:hypothetical protein